MSLPVLLPGSCCPGPGATSRRSSAPAARTPLPGRPLLSLGLLQLLLGAATLGLAFGALALSSSAPVRNACPFWAGSSVILSGLVGLTTWRRPMLLLVNLFVLLSILCILLNMAAFVLCCQGAQLVSSMSSCQLSELGDVCLCCADGPTSKCPEEKLLRLHAGKSCNTMRVLLKKVMFALCALNALTTAVCLVSAALRYLQVFVTRPPCPDESRPVPEEAEAVPPVSDPDDFVPPAPPPSYFATFCSYTPRLARRMFGDAVIPMPHVYGARIKGVEVFCPLDPPPPYETIARPPRRSLPQETAPMTGQTEMCIESSERSSAASDGTVQNLTNADVQRRQLHAVQSGGSRSYRQQLRRSSSDPLLQELELKVVSCEAATQTEAGLEISAVKLRRGRGLHRPRPSSMVDYQSYCDTKQLVTRFLQRSSSSLTPEVQQLVNSIKAVLRSDQLHMEEAVQSACIIDQVITASLSTPVQPPVSSRTVPLRKHPALLHLRSCGDLSTFTKEARQTEQHRAGARRSRGEQDRPHSLIGVFRESVL